MAQWLGRWTDTCTTRVHPNRRGFETRRAPSLPLNLFGCLEPQRGGGFYKINKDYCYAE